MKKGKKNGRKKREDRILLCLYPEEKMKLEKLANKEGRSVNNLVRKLVNDAIEKEKI